MNVCVNLSEGVFGGQKAEKGKTATTASFKPRASCLKRKRESFVDIKSILNLRRD